MEPVLTPEMIRAAAPDVVMPTPPGEREVALLERMLQASDVEGIEQLRAQVRGVQVAPGSDATARIYLVHPDAPRAGFSSDGRAKLPGQFLVRSPRGHVIGQLVLWIERGHLRALQFIRHDAQPALTLPPPSWLEVPEPETTDADVSAPVRVMGAQHALVGVRVLADPPRVGRATDTAPGGRSPWLGRAVAAGVALVVLALAAVALLVARSGGADVDAARAAGASAGSADGVAAGTTLGTFAGSIEGELAGRMSTYDAARRRAVLIAQRAARRKAAEDLAAARAAAYPNPSTCIGYWATDTTWVCT